MAGNHAGGLKCRDKNLKKDPDFYKRIGAIGGRRGHTGGFAGDSERARAAGAKGGRHGKIGKKFIKEEDGIRYFRDLKTGVIIGYDKDNFEVEEVEKD